jgi:hypothetical protein
MDDMFNALAMPGVRSMMSDEDSQGKWKCSQAYENQGSGKLTSNKKQFSIQVSHPKGLFWYALDKLPKKPPEYTRWVNDSPHFLV